MKREVFVVWFTPNKEEYSDQTGWPSLDGSRIAHEKEEFAQRTMEKEPLNKTGSLSVKRFVEAKPRRKK